MWEDKKTAVSRARAYPQSFTASSDWANHPIVPQHFESRLFNGMRRRPMEEKQHFPSLKNYIYIYSISLS